MSMRSMRIDDGCPYCKSSKLLRGFNDLATTHPELVAEWDFERSGDLGPDGVRFSAAKQVWWRCGRGHAWRISAYNRIGGADRDCPNCGDRKVLKGYNGLRTTHPKIARGWNKERNGDLKPTDAIANSNKLVWWKCKEGHEWSGLIANRARRGKAGPGCPYCSGRKVFAGYNDLAATHPVIAPMWHPRMNKRLKPTGVQAVSRKLAGERRRPLRGMPVACEYACPKGEGAGGFGMRGWRWGMRVRIWVALWFAVGMGQSWGWRGWVSFTGPEDSAECIVASNVIKSRPMKGEGYADRFHGRKLDVVQGRGGAQHAGIA